MWQFSERLTSGFSDLSTLNMTDFQVMYLIWLDTVILVFNSYLLSTCIVETMSSTHPSVPDFVAMLCFIDVTWLTVACLANSSFPYSEQTSVVSLEMSNYIQNESHSHSEMLGNHYQLTPCKYPRLPAIYKLLQDIKVTEQTHHFWWLLHLWTTWNFAASGKFEVIPKIKP